MKENIKKNTRTSSTNNKSSTKQGIKKVNKSKKQVDPVIKKRRKKIRKIVITIILLLCLIGGSIYLLTTLQYFNITKINVPNLTKYTNNEIIEKSQLELNTNIFLSSMKYNKKAIEELPYVDSVKLSIKLPNQIQLKIKEKVSIYVAFDKENNTFYRLDKDGYILEKINIEDKTNEEVLLFGISFDNEVTLGSKINEIDLTKLTIYGKVLNEYNKNEIPYSITKVNFENSLTTLTLDDKLNVIFPNDTNVEYKMVLFKSILEKLPENVTGIIDLTKTDPIYSSF